MLSYWLTVGLLAPIVVCQQKPFWIEDETESHSDSPGLGRDEYTPAYAGIISFAHLPFVNCLHPRYSEEAHEKFDIAIVGAPFDTAVTYRPGCQPG